MKDQPHIAFIGDLTIDKYVQSGEIRLGGAALNGSIWARKLGAKPSVVTTVGTDMSGKEMVKKLKKEHISKTHLQIKHGNTSSIEITVDNQGERSYGVWDPGTLASYHFREKDIAYLSGMDAIVVTVYPQFAHILDELSAVKKNQPGESPYIIVNFGDLKEFHGDINIVVTALSIANLCVFGLHETEDSELISRLESLARKHTRHILITMAAKGSRMYAADTVYSEPAKLVTAVDTTGAGDSFLSAYLIKFLDTGDVKASLRAGTELASQVIQRIGAY